MITLTKYQHYVLKQAIRIIALNANGKVEITHYEEAFVPDEQTIIFEANWCACGDCSVDEARDFMKHLQIAIEICEKLNDCEISSELDKTDRDVTEKECRIHSNFMAEILQTGDVDTIKSLLTAL